MLALLIPLAWLLIFQIARRLFILRREAALAAAVIWALLLVLVTELLSSVNQFAQWPMAFLWTLVIAISSLICFRIRSHPIPIRKSDPIPKKFSTLLGLTAIIFVVVAVAILTIVAPPNNWDSMTYHLGKVANWIQHKNVGHYQTSITRQLFLGPWSEFAVANVQILFGSDRFASIIQYFAMIGSVLGVSAIARTLGAGRAGQIFASLFAATLPMGILQASSTQTDYVQSFWTICAVHWALKIISQREALVTMNWFLFGASTAIGFLSKATSIFFMAPFAFWLLLNQFQQKGERITKPVLICILLFISVNACHFYRNWNAFGSPLGDTRELVRFKNEIHTPGALASNVLRNLSMSMGIRHGESLVPVMRSLVRKISRLSPDDTRITWKGKTFNFFYSLHEDSAGNPIQLLLGTLALLGLLTRKNQPRITTFFALCTMGGFILFCGYLRWQPWISRLQLPFFLLIAPLFGLVAQTLRWQPLKVALTVLLFASALPCLFRGEPRSLIGRHNIFTTSRIDQYFLNRPYLQTPYTQASNVILASGCNDIALVCDVDDWEYALRVLLPGKRFYQLGVPASVSRCRSYQPAGAPEIVVVTSGMPVPPQMLGYQAVFVNPLIKVLVSPQIAVAFRSYFPHGRI